MMAIVLVFAAVNAAGCAFFKPSTEISVNPISKTIRYVNTKDTEGQLKGLKGSWTTPDGGSGSFELAELSASDKSSPVLERLEKTMLAFVEQQKAGNEGIRIALSGLSELAQQVVPLVGMLRSQTSEMIELQTMLGTLRKQSEKTPVNPTLPSATQPESTAKPPGESAGDDVISAAISEQAKAQSELFVLKDELARERDKNSVLTGEVASLRALLIDGPSASDADKSSSATEPDPGTSE